MRATTSPHLTSFEKRSGIQRKLQDVSLPIWLLVLSILLYASYFSYLTLTRYAAFEARALDLGNLNQTIWNTAFGRPFQMTNQPGTLNRLSLHVEPILLPIALVYRIYPHPETLLILQSSIVALGALPLFALAWRQLQNSWWALAFALAFLLNPSMQAANWLEFHPVTLAPTLLLAAFYFLNAGRNGWFAGFAILAAACKEEIALLIFMMGLYALIRLRAVKVGVTTLLLALTWALVAVLGIQNLFAAGNIHWGRYHYLGESPGAMVQTLLTRWDLVFAQLQAAHALDYLAALLLPVGFTALLAPEVLVLALPSLGINLLADFPPMHQVYKLIYAAPIAPFVLLASVMGVARLQQHLPACVVHRWRWQDKQLPFALGNELPQALVLIMLLGALYAQWRHGYLPGGGNHRLYAVTEHHRRAAAIMAQIPPTAKVSAQDKLNPHVSGRETVYIFPELKDANTVFVDVTGPAWPQHPADLRQSVTDLLAQGWGIGAAADGYLLLNKGALEQRLPPTFYSAWQEQGRLLSEKNIATFGDQFILRRVDVERDAQGELVVKLAWQLHQQPQQDVQFYIAYLDPEGNELHSTQFYPPTATLWYPTSLWSPTVAHPESDAAIVVQTLPWTLTVERFVLVLGLFTSGTNGADWQNGGDRLQVTALGAPLPVFEGGTLLRLGGYTRITGGGWQPIPLFSAPPTTPISATFGSEFVLTGMTLPKTRAKPGETMPFTLYWRRGPQAPALDYSWFVHLVDAKGDKVTQLDWQPRDAVGRLPATTWLVDQPVVDTEEFVLPATVQPGDYTLIVGIYNGQTGERLPVQYSLQNDDITSDVYILTGIQIE